MSIQTAKAGRAAIQETDFTPIRILELELGQPIPTLSSYDEKVGKHYQRAKCLVRLHTQPLGMVDLTFEKDELSPQELIMRIWQSLALQITEHLREDSLPMVQELTEAGWPAITTPHCLQERNLLLAQAPFVSVIVSTRNRSEKIPTCLDSLLALTYPRYEIIVVDNAPATTATAELIQQRYADEPKVRYVHEDRPGLSWARNCGIKAAKGKILAFTDDDVVADRHWLTELVHGFGLTDNVACVTGLILPLELETPPQVWIEEFGGPGKGFSRRVFNRLKRHVHLYKAGLFGAGANMAFTSAFLHSVNGFDTALGAGSLVCSAEDTAAFFQVIMHSYKLVYEPSALIYHQHYRDYNDLCKQFYNYGIGFPAYVTKCVLENPRLLLDLTTKVPCHLFLDLTSRLSKHNKRSEPYIKELRMFQRRGMLYGLPAYVQSRWTQLSIQRATSSIRQV